MRAGVIRAVDWHHLTVRNEGGELPDAIWLRLSRQEAQELCDGLVRLLDDPDPEAHHHLMTDGGETIITLGVAAAD